MRLFFCLVVAALGCYLVAVRDQLEAWNGGIEQTAKPAMFAWDADSKSALVDGGGDLFHIIPGPGIKPKFLKFADRPQCLIVTWAPRGKREQSNKFYMDVNADGHFLISKTSVPLRRMMDERGVDFEFEGEGKITFLLNSDEFAVLRKHVPPWPKR